MSKTDALKMTGHVIEVLPGTKFKVKLDDVDMVVTCSLNGKLRINRIVVILGDKVDVEFSPYDLSNGRICWRYK